MNSKLPKEQINMTSGQTKLKAARGVSGGDSPRCCLSCFWVLSPPASPPSMSTSQKSRFPNLSCQNLEASSQSGELQIYSQNWRLLITHNDFMHIDPKVSMDCIPWFSRQLSSLIEVMVADFQMPVHQKHTQHTKYQNIMTANWKYTCGPGMTLLQHV